MKKRHDKPPRRRDRVAEPVQVYLAPADRERLQRLATELDATKSDVLRQGLAALEAQLTRSVSRRQPVRSLPTYAGQGLQPGVDLDDTASLHDLMDARDAAR
jgi:hypothetical protein